MIIVPLLLTHLDRERHCDLDLSDLNKSKSLLLAAQQQTKLKRDTPRYIIIIIKLPY